MNADTCAFFLCWIRYYVDRPVDGRTYFYSISATGVVSPLQLEVRDEVRPPTITQPLWLPLPQSVTTPIVPVTPVVPPTITTPEPGTGTLLALALVALFVLLGRMSGGTIQGHASSHEAHAAKKGTR